MLDFIPGWDLLMRINAVKFGELYGYVAYSMSKDIRTPFYDPSKSAIVTIAQRNSFGRLCQKSLYNPHFTPRKFTITAKHAGVQIRWIYQLISGLNDGTIDPDSIPTKVSNVRAWDAIRTMLECSVGPIDA